MNNKKCFIYVMATAAGKHFIPTDAGVFYVLSFIVFFPFLAFPFWTKDEQKA